jgi:hypothetical protein
VLRADHIQSVVVMSEQFKIFVNKTKTGDEETRARADLLRNSSTRPVSQESSFNLGLPARR